MKKYNVSVEFTEVGYNKIVSIFGVISIVLKESKHAKVIVREL